jgi:hypothetical protein
VMGRLVHTGLGSSSLVAHVLPYPPPPHVNIFVLGPAVINTHTFDRVYTSSSAPQCERKGPPGGPFLRSNWLRAQQSPNLSAPPKTFKVAGNIPYRNTDRRGCCGTGTADSGTVDPSMTRVTAFMYACMHACMYIDTYMHACVYVYTYTYTYVYKFYDNFFKKNHIYKYIYLLHVLFTGS